MHGKRQCLAAEAVCKERPDLAQCAICAEVEMQERPNSNVTASTVIAVVTSECAYGRLP